jgi:mannose-6-phosphate isomerase
MTDGPHTLYPLQFEPILKDYPWGGRAIGTRLGRAIPPGPVAESWEISAHPGGPTTVSNGVYAGRGLGWLQHELGEALVGRRNRNALEQGTFPLLVKLLDAREWLSVQVHPEDDFARSREGDLGKTEMWVVLDAEPGAAILLGFRAGVDVAALRQAITDGSVVDYLHRTPARAGDVFFVPPGTVHAIGPGVLLAEIQQSSNVTYRVFDWNRTPERTLHVERALEVLNFEAEELEAVKPVFLESDCAELLAECPYFRTERLALKADDEMTGDLQGDSFEIWGALEGSVTVEGGAEQVELSSVSWTLLPAALGAFRLQAHEPSTLLRILTPGLG